MSCCPNNVARTFASLATYLVTADSGGLQIHQNADAEVSTRLDGGRPAGFAMRTAYPDDGAVSIRITHTSAAPWTLSLRVPAWAEHGAELVEPDGTRRPVHPGVVEVTRTFAIGDEVRLELPMAPRWVSADPRARPTAQHGSVDVAGALADAPDQAWPYPPVDDAGVAAGDEQRVRVRRAGYSPAAR